jgi:hypothetical protein
MSFVAMILAMTSPARGVLLYYEGFNYAPTDNINGVGGWIDPNGVVGVSADGLDYPGLATEGGSAKKRLPHTDNISSNASDHAHKLLGSAVQDLFKSESNVFYISYLAGDVPGSTNPLGPSRRGNLALNRHFGDGSKTNDGLNMGTTGCMCFQVEEIPVGEGNGNPGDGGPGTKMFVGRITMAVGDDAFAAIVDPNLATLVDSDFNTAETAFGEISAASDENLDWLGLWIGTYGPTTDGDNTLMDEIRIGTTLADVTPIPEPASVALLGLGGLMLLRRRRA